MKYCSLTNPFLLKSYDKKLLYHLIMITLYKNVYDILTATPTPRQLEEKMEAILEVCLKKNMKSPPQSSNVHAK